MTQSLNPGSTLPNGATLITHTLMTDGGGTGEGTAIVLAIYRGEEYVTWNVDIGTGEAFNGHYFSKWSFHKAVEDLWARGGTPSS